MLVIRIREIEFIFFNKTTLTMEDDFDIEIYEVDNKRQLKEEKELCCDKEYIVYFDRKECSECGSMIRLDEYHNVQVDTYNSGRSTEKASARMIKKGETKSFVIYSTYDITKENKVKQEFNNIRDNFLSIDDSIINEAMDMYNKVIVQNKIVKKKHKKACIQKACIYIVYENIGYPRSKTEFAKLVGETENGITKGYNFINEVYRKKQKDKVIQNISSDLTIRFIVRFTPEDILIKRDKKRPGYKALMERFLRNLAHYVKLNNGLHLNKYPECLAVGIIYFSSTIFDWKVTLEHLHQVSKISVKNIKSYHVHLFRVKEDENNIYHEKLNYLISYFNPKQLSRSKD